MRRLARHSWVIAVVPIWLGSRAFAYALAPAGPLARQLGAQTGGPAPLLVGATAIVLALGLGAGILWVASLSVRERAALAQEEAPALDLRRHAGRAIVLFAVATLLFTVVEVWLHMRAGLGFHGLACLRGPVHRDALPFLAAFSVAAALVSAALERLVRWARRTLKALRQRAPRLRPALLQRPVAQLFVALDTPRRVLARGPPLTV